MKEIDGTVGIDEINGIVEMKKTVGMFQWNCNRKYSTDWNDWTEGMEIM